MPLKIERVGTAKLFKRKGRIVYGLHTCEEPPPKSRMTSEGTAGVSARRHDPYVPARESQPRVFVEVRVETHRRLIWNRFCYTAGNGANDPRTLWLRNLALIILFRPCAL